MSSRYLSLIATMAAGIRRQNADSGVSGHGSASFPIALLWPHPESHPNARRVIHPRCVRCWQRSNLQGQPRFITRPLLGLGPRAYGLARERFTQHLCCKRPFHESRHKCVHETIQSARNYSGPVFPQRVKALGYALLHAHRLHRHGPRVEPKLGQHRRVCQWGRHGDLRVIESASSNIRVEGARYAQWVEQTTRRRVSLTSFLAYWCLRQNSSEALPPCSGSRAKAPRPMPRAPEPSPRRAH